MRRDRQPSEDPRTPSDLLATASRELVVAEPRGIASLSDEIERLPGGRSMYYDLKGEPISLRRWIELWKDNEIRIIGRDDVCGLRVSTVWLGTDHNFGGRGAPIIFETMVFADKSYNDLCCYRYATSAEAIAGHRAVVALIKEHAPKEVEARLKALPNVSEEEGVGTLTIDLEGLSKLLQR